MVPVELQMCTVKGAPEPRTSRQNAGAFLNGTSVDVQEFSLELCISCGTESRARSCNRDLNKADRHRRYVRSCI